MLENLFGRMSRIDRRHRLTYESATGASVKEVMTMKYMIMMFGSASEMGETQSPEWIKDMIAYMIKLDKDLSESGELVYNEGLSDPDTAKLVALKDGVPVTTDGPFAEAKESIIGFWIVDVANEERVIEIASSIVKYSNVVEVRQVPAGPPEV